MSEQAKPQGKSLQREILHLAGVLLIICTVCAGLLGWVNSITADKIVAINLEKTNTALSQVMPEADRFEQLGIAAVNPDEPWNAALVDGTFPEPVQAAWAAYSDDTPAGLCVQVAPQGFGGQVVTIVGVNTDGVITGVRVTTQSETAGVGTKATDPTWLEQFAGLEGPLQVVKNIATGGQDIVAVTGATVTSAAVTQGVQAALTFAQALMGGAD